MSGAARRGLSVDVVIPALDEEGAIGQVVAGLRAAALPGAEGGRVRRVVVVDNGSSDGTAAVARAAGAEVVREPRRGYGAACLAGIALLQRSNPPDVLLFADGDGSDDPGDLASLLRPIVEGGADLCVGSRALGGAERGSLTPQQRAGNAVAAAVIRVVYRARCTDLGPLRAIRWDALTALGMADRDYGWTVEMQVKALRRGQRVVEVPVRYRRRAAGRSKVSGTLRGTVGAGWKILSTIARHAI